MSLPKLTWGVGMTLTAPDGLSDVYFQPGDDAQALIEEYEGLEKTLGVDGALRELWHTYSDLAEPISSSQAA